MKIRISKQGDEIQSKNEAFRDDKQTITEQEHSGVVKHEACNSPAEEGSTENGNCSVVVCDNKETQAKSDDGKKSGQICKCVETDSSGPNDGVKKRSKSTSSDFDMCDDEPENERELESLRAEYKSLVDGLRDFINDNTYTDKENKRSTETDLPLSAQVKYVFECMTERHEKYTREQLTQFNKTEITLQDKISALNNKAADEEQKGARLTNELNATKSEIREKNKKISELQSSCEKMKRVTLKHDDEIKQKDKTFSDKIRSLNKDKDGLQAVIKQKEKDIKHLEKELRNRMTDIEKSDKVINVQTTAITELNTRQTNMNWEMTKKSKQISLLEDDKKLLGSELECAKQQLNNQYSLLYEKDQCIQGMNRQLNDQHWQLRNKDQHIQGMESHIKEFATIVSELEGEKSTLTLRLSKLAGAQLTTDNPNITDLSDMNRPTKLAEKYSELYDNEWADAFEECQEKWQMGEIECVKRMLHLLKVTNAECVKLSQPKTDTLTNMTRVTVKVDKTPVSADIPSSSNTTSVNIETQTPMDPKDETLQTELQGDDLQSDSKLHGDNSTKEEPMDTSESNTEHVTDVLQATQTNQNELQTGTVKHVSNTNTAEDNMDNLGNEPSSVPNEETEMNQDELQTGQTDHVSNTNKAEDNMDNLGNEPRSEPNEATKMNQDKLQTGPADNVSNTNTAEDNMDNLRNEPSSEPNEATQMNQDERQTGPAEHVSNTNKPEESMDNLGHQSRNEQDATHMNQDERQTGPADHVSNTNKPEESMDTLGHQPRNEQDTVPDDLATHPTTEDAADAQLVQKKEASEVKVGVPMDLPLGFGTNVDTGEVTGEVEIKHEFTAEQKKIVSELIKVCGAKLEEEGNISQVIARKVAFEKGIDPKTNEMTFAYIARCAHICWYIAIQDPPVVIGFHELEGDAAFEKDTYKAYTKVGKNLDFVVWPPLYLHKGGAMLSKGTAQGKN